VVEDELEQGRAVAEQAIAAAQAVFRGRLAAAYLIGSLAHGGFVAAVSDVDVALVLDGADHGDPARVQDSARRVRQQNDSPLAGRLSVFWASGQSLRSGHPAGRLPAIDWLDLVESGELAHGLALPDGLQRPAAAQLVAESASFAVSKWRQDPNWHRRLRDGAGLVREGRRAASKAALFPVRFLHTLATGRADGTPQAADWYCTTLSGPSRQLVDAAYRWRTHGFDDTNAAARLLNDQLVPLYRQFEAAYRPRLHEQDLHHLAGELTATIALLDRTDTPPASSRRRTVVSAGRCSRLRCSRRGAC